MFKKIRHIHLVGIGGTGMSGIAEVLINLGYKVSGSDVKETSVTRRLQDMGGVVYEGHDNANIAGADVVVVSTAIEEDNPEVEEARVNTIPVIPRAEMLAELMRLKYSVIITGTHGKTTTTSMTGLLLAHNGLDPTVVIGGKLKNFGSNAKLGKGDFLIAEGDESDGSFLKLTPTIAVVTNIDSDHLDHYGNINKIRKAFLEFVNKVPFYGTVIVCSDDVETRKIIRKIKRKYITYGIKKKADIVACDIVTSSFETQFNLKCSGKKMGSIKLSVPGIHNVYNALAAIAVAMELDVSVDNIREGFSDFSGVERRIEMKGDINGVIVIDDYAHHPTEIKATLDALRGSCKKRLIAVFQPHRFSRTKLLAKDFGTAFDAADVVVVTDIYPAGEKPIPGVSAQLIKESIEAHNHKEVEFFSSSNEIVEFISGYTEPGDVVLTLGAGDVWKIGESLLENLRVKV
ncbi:MAG: UDP-N-acetylmuramate--L-alanine ligase [bacterium]